MSRRTRRVVALVALCVAASMALGVGSYSSVSAERSVSVSVVPPEEAYLGFGDDLQCGAGGGVGDNDQFIKNQFSGNTTIEHIEVRVTAVDGYVEVGVKGSGSTTPLWDGKSTVLTFDGPYEPGDAAGVHLKPAAQGSNITGADHLKVELVEAAGPSVHVTETSLRYDIHCPDRDDGKADKNEDDGDGRDEGKETEDNEDEAKGEDNED